jgi:hypothetical protein
MQAHSRGGPPDGGPPLATLAALDPLRGPDRCAALQRVRRPGQFAASAPRGSSPRLHSKKQTFVDDGDEANELEIEDEANSFAAGTLVPRAAAKLLPSLRSGRDVELFASEIGISPGIVVGRLHNDGLAPSDSQAQAAAQRWLNAERAVIQLTDRYKREDNFWFAFFHEAAQKPPAISFDTSCK